MTGLDLSMEDLGIAELVLSKSERCNAIDAEFDAIAGLARTDVIDATGRALLAPPANR
ncbi:hypothetical protein G6038_24975 [Rhodococcus sp. 14C212]|uniref:hypothetical protein n=1 Tax=Rhodococcus sp. 14C212 TaxID=2711209 RepID=UPI0013EDCD63|nr:hypothetical protein [Rhodococcus sp. 14C212]NGP08663.1 hypothetical protein [Rhodococcus sp. 14C212]